MFRSGVEQCLSESDYELNLCLSEADAFIFVRGEKILNACKEALESQEQEPLSDDAIRNCLYNCKTQDFLQFARAIEAAHGIGVKDA